MFSPAIGLFIFSLLVAISCGGAPSLAQTSQNASASGDATQDLNFRVGNFYRQGDIADVSRFVSGWVAARAPPYPMIGFVAGVAAKYPDKIDRMFPPELGENERRMAVFGVRIGVSTARAEELARSLGLPETQLPQPDAATLDDIRISTPNIVSLLWGAGFATGNPRYPQRVLDYYVSVANRGEIDIDMIVRSLTTMPDYSPDVITAVQKSQGDLTAWEVALAAKALWSLETNAARHDFVKTVVDAYLVAHPDTPASAGLRRVNEVAEPARLRCKASPREGGCLNAF